MIPNLQPPKRIAGLAFSRDHILYIAEALLDPLIMILTLWGVALYSEGELAPFYLLFSVIIFSITFPSTPKIHLPALKCIEKILVTWVILASLLFIFGASTRYILLFSHKTIMLWLGLTPLFQILAVFALKKLAPKLIQLQGPVKRAIVVGMNPQGLELANRLSRSQYDSAELLGFFDDRTPERIPPDMNFPMLGVLDEVAEYIKKNLVHVIYLSLPMASQPRILKLLDELKDTTASIYFVPDIFMTDLIQGRMDQVDGIPVVAVRESPFTGMDGLVKRFTDVVLSIIILTLISPILLVVAIGVKVTSPGPIIFKQRRYGLDGQEIFVYKFRSMTVCEDGATVVQATKQDQRITPLGGFLRKSSLDELPQFFNVIQGRMSIVGPRPHAVSHNEMYRKLIKGYMIRHKVKPGITGWAQVNGLRGETETLDKMKARIDYDIDYLRNWSPRLDFYIIFKTIWVVFKGQKGAY